jgi:hypothetical protein
MSTAIDDIPLGKSLVFFFPVYIHGFFLIFIEFVRKYNYAVFYFYDMIVNVNLVVNHKIRHN